MEFTNEQKLIVALLTDIHAKLEIQDGVDPNFVQRMVSEDQGWALKWKYQGLFSEGGTTPPDVEFVANVLTMWSRLEESYSSLDDEGRKVLLEKAPVFGKAVKFPGFDGNNEAELLSIARILVDDLDRWQEFEGGVRNSHMPLADAYGRMLAVSDAILAKNTSGWDHGNFDAEDLAQVINEMAHPDNR